MMEEYKFEKDKNESEVVRITNDIIQKKGLRV